MIFFDSNNFVCYGYERLTGKKAEIISSL